MKVPTHPCPAPRRSPESAGHPMLRLAPQWGGINMYSLLRPRDHRVPSGLQQGQGADVRFSAPSTPLSQIPESEAGSPPTNRSPLPNFEPDSAAPALRD